MPQCNVQCSAEKFILLLPSVLSKCILKLFKCLQLLLLYMQITVCCYTCTLHPMMLILHVVEFSFTKNTNILFKEVNMYLKLPWKLLGAWKKEKSGMPRQENLLVLDDTEYSSAGTKINYAGMFVRRHYLFWEVNRHLMDTK